jgi:hypothetical protein
MLRTPILEDWRQRRTDHHQAEHARTSLGARDPSAFISHAFFCGAASIASLRYSVIHAKSPPVAPTTPPFSTMTIPAQGKMSVNLT